MLTAIERRRVTRALLGGRRPRAALRSAANAVLFATTGVALYFRDTDVWRAHAGALRAAAAAAALVLFADYGLLALRAWRAGRLSPGGAFMAGIMAVVSIVGGWMMFGAPGVTEDAIAPIAAATLVAAAVAAWWGGRRFYGAGTRSSTARAAAAEYGER